MDDADRDTLMRMAAFEHVRRLGEVHDHLTATEWKPGFVFTGAHPAHQSAARHLQAAADALPAAVCSFIPRMAAWSLQGRWQLGRRTRGRALRDAACPI